MEKNMKKNIYIYIYVTESIFCAAEINTALEINDTWIKSIKKELMLITFYFHIKKQVFRVLLKKQTNIKLKFRDIHLA